MRRALAIGFAAMLVVAIACTGGNKGGNTTITETINGPFSGGAFVCADQPCAPGDTCVSCDGTPAATCSPLGICAPTCTSASPSCGPGLICIFAWGPGRNLDAGLSVASGGGGSAPSLPVVSQADSGVTSVTSVECSESTSSAQVEDAILSTAGPPAVGTCVLDCTSHDVSCGQDSCCAPLGGGGVSACVPYSAPIHACAGFAVTGTCPVTTTKLPSCPYSLSQGRYCGESSDTKIYCPPHSLDCSDLSAGCSCPPGWGPVCCDGQTDSVCGTFGPGGSCDAECASDMNVSYNLSDGYEDCVPPAGGSPGCGGTAVSAGVSGSCVCTDGRVLAVACGDDTTCESRCETSEGIVQQEAGIVGEASAPAQAECGTATENNDATVTCPTGQVITAIVFASYGTPTGSCGGFATSSCNLDVTSTVANECLDKTSCSIPVSNAAFGNTDPCVGTSKHLDVEVTCDQ